MEPYFAPNAPALPNAVVDDPTSASEMALAWAPVMLAAGATQNFSVTVALQQPRELLLTPRDAAPAPGARSWSTPRITDDRRSRAASCAGPTAAATPPPARPSSTPPTARC